MRIEPFRTEHLLKIKIREVDGLGESAKEVLEKTANNSMAYTAIENEHIIFVVGASQLWPGVVELWLVITPMFMQRKKTAVKLFWQFMQQMKDIGIRRAQADIRADITKDINFIKHFGFVFESEMKRYGINDETYLRFVWLGE